MTGLLVLTGCAGAVTGCTSSDSTGATATPGAAEVVASLGAVPIPTPATSAPLPTASAGHVAVLAMGEPAAVVLASGSRATVTASGPEQDSTAPVLPTPGKPPPATRATVTVSVRATGGGATVLRAADLLSRDDTGASIALTPVGPASVTAAPGTTRQLRVSGLFHSGSAQVTWRPAGAPVAVWDFTIELD